MSFLTTLVIQAQGVFVNQIGYFPEAKKVAIVTCDADSFSVFSISENKSVFKGKLSSPKYWYASDEIARTADFSAVAEPGKYKILVGDIESFPFEIKDKVYENVAKAALKAFYYQRASAALPEKYAGKWARKFAVPDTAVIVHKSAESKTRKAGSVISAPKGWFDAGDYNKYIVNSAITTYTLILLYETFTEAFQSVKINIPESSNNTPDLLDEILWNIRWMMKMQDPADGGVYHKLTYANFQPYVMPDEITAPRFVVGKSTSAALDFSATLAHFSIALKKNNPELKLLSDSCLAMAKNAWNWAVKNPDVYFHNPSDITTGEYKENYLLDNFFWAGIELFFATGNKSYLRYLDKIDEIGITPLDWAHVAMLGILSALNYQSKEVKFDEYENIERVFRKSVENLYEDYLNSPYKISLNVFKWGSNGNLLNETLILLSAYKFYNEDKYLDAAISNADYILGKNPLNICYVTDFGSKFPMNIHHRISIADGIEEPVPGFVVGGPNPNNVADIGAENYSSLLPAKCYADNENSYSTNEVAINWNAPLVFVLFTIENIVKKNKISLNKN